MPDTTQDNKDQDNQTPSSTAEQLTTQPEYRKPTIRRYDQIEQVKPYGPSEKEAG